MAKYVDRGIFLNKSTVKINKNNKRLILVIRSRLCFYQILENPCEKQLF